MILISPNVASNPIWRPCLLAEPDWPNCNVDITDRLEANLLIR